MANGFLLAKDYGVPRVMSSYTFTQHDAGPPHNADWTVSDERFALFLCIACSLHHPPSIRMKHATQVSQKKLSEKKLASVASGWQCEHRWPIIRRMVQFHNAVNSGLISNIVDDENHRLAFARGGKHTLLK